jgi:HEAT repeat protein
MGTELVVILFSVLSPAMSGHCELFGNKTILEVLEKPDRTEVYGLSRDYLAKETRKGTGQSLSPAQIKAIYDLLRERVKDGHQAPGCMNFYAPTTSIKYVKADKELELLIGIDAYNLRIDGASGKIDMNCEKALLDPMAKILEGIAPRMTPTEHALIGDRTPGSVALLVSALSDSKPEIREKAAQALYLNNDSTAVKPLIARLNDDSPGVRARAAEALSALHAKESIPAIKKVLKDSHAEVRASAIGALSDLNADDSDRIFENALKDPSPDVRSSAARALGRSNSTKEQALLAALNDPAIQVRAEAIRSLQAMQESRKLSGPAQVVQGFVARLRDSNENVRLAAAEALHFTRDKRVVASLISAAENGPSKVQAAIAMSLDNKDMSLAEITRILDSTHPRLRAQGLNKLNCYRPSPELWTRIEKLANDQESVVRAAAVRCVASLEKQTPASLSVLSRMLRDNSSEVRFQAIQHARLLGDAIPITEIVPLIDDSDHNVRVFAVRAIGVRKDPTKKGLLEKALKHNDPGVREWAQLILSGARDGN